MQVIVGKPTRRSRFHKSAQLSLFLSFFLPSLLCAFGIPIQKCAYAQAQSAPNPAAPNHMQVFARAVSLDVIVTDRQGNPVTGLKSSDFGITEDGVDQKITDVVAHEVKTTTAQDANQPTSLAKDVFSVAPNFAQHEVATAIVLGRMGTFDASYVRDRIRAYLRANKPQMPIALFHQDQGGMHLVQDFTMDQQALVEAAGSKRMLPPPSFLPAKHSSHLRIGELLDRYPGRINLIWFASLNAATDPDRSKAEMIMEESGLESLRLGRVALYTVDARGLVVATSNTWREIRDHRRNELSLPNQFIRLTNPAQDSGGRSFSNTNGFDRILENVIDDSRYYYTISYIPSNRSWDGGWRSIHLAAPRGTSPSGRFLKTVSFDDTYQLQYRRGYFARLGGSSTGWPTNEFNSSWMAQSIRGMDGFARETYDSSIDDSSSGEIASPEIGASGRLARALAFAAPLPTNIHFTVEVAKQPVAGNISANTLIRHEHESRQQQTQRLLLHYRLRTSDLNFKNSPDGNYLENLRFAAALYHDDGTLANSILSPVNLDLNQATRKGLAQAPLSLDQHMDISLRGEYFLRVCVEELGTGHIGALEVPIEF